jgi:polysaccharide biosynthesis/export protein
MKRVRGIVLLFAASSWAQYTPLQPSVVAEPLPTSSLNRRLDSAPTSVVSTDYRIGAEDLLEISVFEVPELSRTVRVSASGEISLPLVGSTRAAGLTQVELEKSLIDLLRESYVKDPQVNVFLKEYKSDPVSVVGAVKIPGLYHIQTRKSLIEVLAMAQGFSESDKMLPGRTIVISHKQPIGDAATGSSAVEEIPIKELLESGETKWNVAIYPGDIIKVVPAGTFYVAGDVNQPGSFALRDFDNVSSVQAVAMAGGTKKTAKLKEAVIIRRDTSGNRIEEKLDLNQILRGKAPDARLSANDILFIPGSVKKEAGLRGLEAAINVATGVLVFGL